MPVSSVREAVTSDYVQTLIKIKASQLRKRPDFWATDMEELQQELVLHVVQNAHLFDPVRGTVNTFISTVVETAAARMCRDRRRIKRGARLNVQSLEDVEPRGEDGEDVTLAETLLESDLHRRRGDEVAPVSDQQVRAMDFADTLGSLSPQTQQVARLMMDDVREAAISHRLGISRRQVRRAVEEIRRQVKAAGLTDSASSGQSVRRTA